MTAIEIIVSVSPRKHHIVFSTKNPASVQKIPWPSDDSGDHDDSASMYLRQIGNENWMLDDDEFPWLVEPDGKKSTRSQCVFLTLFCSVCCCYPTLANSWDRHVDYI